MRITTESAIHISESLASFLMASHIYNTRGCDPVFEKRMSYVNTAKYTIADIYLPSKSVAFEVKSVKHGTSAIKSVLQCSIYLEQVDKSIVVMQKPRRKNLKDAIEGFASQHGVGVIWITNIPKMCSKNTVEKATGGCAKPFELWKKRRYSSTKQSIISRSTSNWSDEYISTLEEIVKNKKDKIFQYSIEPDKSPRAFSELYWE